MDSFSCVLPTEQRTASVMLSNHRAKLTEDSGTCFQFLKMRCTVATSPVTDKFVSSFPVVSATLLLGQTPHPLERPKTNPGLSHLLHLLPQPGSICWVTTAGFLWSPSWGHRLPPRLWAPLLLQGATCTHHTGTSWTQVTSGKVWVTWGMDFLEKEVPHRLTFLNPLSKSMRTLLGDSFRVLPCPGQKALPTHITIPSGPTP